ncbi:MAG: hypothetical protein KDH08_24060, partial [Anaerolineae bacterium]|nr:hypothetical protein [Anaerolineae bacterium]
TIGWIAVGLFGILGVSILVAQVLGPQAWWRVIPGMTLLGIAGVVLLSIQDAPPVWIASALFAAIALAFLIIYAGERQERWWALVPFGAMAVMVAVMILSNAGWPATAVGVVLFAGMGLVFLLVYGLAKDRRALAWALTPAVALVLMALVALAAYVATLNSALAGGVRFWPVLLVILGVVLIGYGVTRSRKPAPPPGQLSAQPEAVAPAASGTAAFTMSDSQPAAPSRRMERSPITLHDEPPKSEATSQQELGDDFDIYDFLKSAPPES